MKTITLHKLDGTDLILVEQNPIQSSLGAIKEKIHHFFPGARVGIWSKEEKEFWEEIIKDRPRDFPGLYKDTIVYLISYHEDGEIENYQVEQLKQAFAVGGYESHIEGPYEYRHGEDIEVLFWKKKKENPRLWSQHVHLRSGKLTKFGYCAHCGEETRHKALEHCARADGHGTCMKRINLLANITRDAHLKRIYRADTEWLGKH